MARLRTAAKSTKDFIEQGLRLREALAKGAADFDEIVRAEDFGHRKAHYLISIANAFEHSPLPRSDLIGVGWTKLGMLADRVNEPTFASLVERAKTLPVPELRRVLQGDEARASRHVVQLNLSEEQFEVLAKVVDQYGGVRVGRVLHKREEALTRALEQLLEVTRATKR